MAGETRKVAEVFEEDGLEVTRYDDGTQDWVIKDFPDDLYEEIVKRAESEGVSPEELIIRMLWEGVENGGVACKRGG
jgi:hypothetical protein